MKKGNSDEKYNFVALQVNYKFDTNTEKNPNNVARTVDEWVKWRANMFESFYKDNPKSVESIAWIVHDKDMQLDTANDGEPITDDNGNPICKPAHIHAVIEFKKKNRKRLSTIRNYFGITYVDNCKGINLNVTPIALPYRYLIHISEKALSESTKHIYSPDEVHTIGNIDYTDVIGIDDASDAKKFVKGIENAFGFSSTTSKKSKKADPLEDLFEKDGGSVVATFFAETIVAVQNGRWTKIQAHDAIFNEIEHALMAEKYSSGERIYSDERIETICSLFWNKFSGQFEHAEDEYINQRAGYMKGATASQQKPKFLRLSPLDDPDSRNLTTIYIAGGAAVGKSQLAKYLGRRLDYLKRGVHFCPAPAEDKTFDFVNMYHGEDVSVFNDIEPGAFQKREFFNVFDEHQTAPVSSRNNDKFWLAHYAIFTNSTPFEQFVNDLLKYSKGGSKYFKKANDSGIEFLDDEHREEYLDVRFQAMRRMNFVIETKKHAGGHGADYYLYIFHAFRYEDGSPDIGHWLTHIYSVDDVRDGNKMQDLANEVGNHIDDYKRALLSGNDAYAFTFEQKPCNLFPTTAGDGIDTYNLGFYTYDNQKDGYVLVEDVKPDTIKSIQKDGK